MYNTFLYPFGGNATLTVTNLPSGNYNFYVYGQESGYHVTGDDGTDYGILSTTNARISNPIAWQEGVQYVVFRGLQVTNVAQSFTLTVVPGPGGYAVISGLQIAGTRSAEESPIIRSSSSSKNAPITVTLDATSITSTGAVLNASVNPNGVETIAWFDWGRTIDYGLSSLSQPIGSNSVAIPLTTALTGISNNITYYFRVAASNSFGVRFGSDLSFTWTADRPWIAASVPAPGEKFALHFSGAAGRKYMILGSTNLSSWEVLGSATEADIGTFRFGDNNPTNFPARFYRIFAP